MTPDCMTADEVQLWRDAPYNNATVPCIDCPIQFAAEMLRQGCCNGSPGYVFGRPRLPRGDRPTELARARARRYYAKVRA